jgi:hydroxypyruvate isomerase
MLHPAAPLTTRDFLAHSYARNPSSGAGSSPVVPAAVLRIAACIYRSPGKTVALRNIGSADPPIYLIFRCRAVDSLISDVIMSVFRQIDDYHFTEFIATLRHSAGSATDSGATMTICFI